MSHHTAKPPPREDAHDTPSDGPETAPPLRLTATNDSEAPNTPPVRPKPNEANGDGSGEPPDPVDAVIEPLSSVDDVARALSASRRTIERMRSAETLPRSDLHAGKMPLWKAETIRRWIEGGGRP